MGKLILHPTAEIFQRGIRVCCPVCREEIIPGMAVEQLDEGDPSSPEGLRGARRWFWVHEECFEGGETPKEAI